MAYSDRFGNFIPMFLKILVALGIVVIAISLMLWLADIVGTQTQSQFLQITVVGVAILAFSVMAYRLFEKL